MREELVTTKIPNLPINEDLPLSFPIKCIEEKVSLVERYKLRSLIKNNKIKTKSATF